MSEDVQRVKDALPIRETVLRLTGLAMKGHHLAECPFCAHHDCFSFPPDGGFVCHSCGTKGDILSFIGLYERLEFPEALKKAAALAGITLSERPHPNPSPGGRRDKEDPPSVKDKIFLAAADYYHANWQAGKNYFIEARKHQESTIAAMTCGWSDGKLLAHLRGSGFADEDILASGLVVERTKKGEMSLDDYFFAGLAIFPHFSQGRVVHFTCKDPNKKYEMQLPKSVFVCPEHPLDVQGRKGKCRACEKELAERPVRGESWLGWNQDALYKKGELIIVEGENDLMSLVDAGAHNVIALCGNPSDERLKGIVSHCSGRHVYLCFDNDDGGHKYVRKFAPLLEAEEAKVRVMGW